MAATNDPLLIQPVIIQMRPGDLLGLDVSITDENCIQGINEGLVADLNTAHPGSIDVGDRIVEVDGKTGNAVENIRAWVQDHKETAATLHLKVARRQVQLQLVTVRMQAGERLGISVARSSTNTILQIDPGIVADLNKVRPGSIEVGDQILEVDGMPGYAIDQIRGWVSQWHPWGMDLPLMLARRVLHPVEDLDSMAWIFSVPVGVRPGESLGVRIAIDSNCISEIEDDGEIASLNNAHPGSVQVGDRILSVDGVPCPFTGSTAKLEWWFQSQTRKLYSKDIPRDLRLTLLRPVAWADAGTVLPPREFCLAPTTVERKPTTPTVLGRRWTLVESVKEEDGSASESASTTDATPLPDAVPDAECATDIGSGVPRPEKTNPLYTAAQRALAEVPNAGAAIRKRGSGDARSPHSGAATPSPVRRILDGQTSAGCVVCF